MSDAQEYLTGNEQVAYPFREDAGGLCQLGVNPVHGDPATLPRDFMLDMVMLAPAENQGQLYLKSILRGSGTTFTFALGTDTATLLTGTISTIPAERTTVEFHDSAGRISCRFVTGPAFSTYLAAMSGSSTDAFHASLPLETAAVEFAPYKLLELMVDTDHLFDKIALYEGYNIQLDGVPGDAAAGAAATITITAGSGLGAGRRPCDPPAPVAYIGLINGQAGDSEGKFNLNTGECHRIIPNPTANALQLYNDCVACCSCDQYASAVAALKVLFEELTLAKDSLEAATAQLDSDIQEWNNEIFPVALGPTVTMAFSPGKRQYTPGDSPIAPNFGSLSATVKNNFNDALPVVIQLAMPSVAIDDVSIYSGDCSGGASGESVGVSPANPWTYSGSLPAKGLMGMTFNMREDFPTTIAGTFTLTVTYTKGLLVGAQVIRTLVVS